MRKEEDGSHRSASSQGERIYSQRGARRADSESGASSVSGLRVTDSESLRLRLSGARRSSVAHKFGPFAVVSQWRFAFQ